MHALVITFTTDTDPDDLEPAQEAFADALLHVDGLVSKTWLRSGQELGGFYLFRDADAAEAYAAGPLVGALRSDPAHRDFRVRSFAVLERLSRRTSRQTA